MSPEQHSFLAVGVAVVLVVATQASEGSWKCSYGWYPFTAAGPISCLWPSPITAYSFSDAKTSCNSYNASLVSIQSREKHDFIKGLVTKMSLDDLWTGLRKSSTPPMWESVYGNEPVTYHPSYFTLSRIYYIRCMVMENTGRWQWEDCSSNRRDFICEKRPDCQEGFFGPRCDKQCHCKGFQCNQTTWNVVCPYGCQPGWMGDACDQKREKASMVYHCIQSLDGDKRVSIDIDLKGIEYRSIQAVDEQKTPMPWCNDTSVTFDPDGHMYVQIEMYEGSTSAINQSVCAGKRIGEESYEWRILFSEWQGLYMDKDQEVVVTCNFSDAESLSRNEDTIVKGNSAIQASQVQESKEDIRLELIDAATKVKVKSVSVSDPVILQIRYGLNEDSNVQSVSPSNCFAQSSDGSQRLVLLDANGCQMDGSPVEPFNQTNKTKTIWTHWFPYFAFQGSSHVVYHCSFVLCYNTGCETGCRSYEGSSAPSRHVRSANPRAGGHLEYRVQLAP